jgi:hypothetical protein
LFTWLRGAGLVAVAAAAALGLTGIALSDSAVEDRSRIAASSVRAHELDSLTAEARSHAAVAFIDPAQGAEPMTAFNVTMGETYRTMLTAIANDPEDYIVLEQLSNNLMAYEEAVQEAWALAASDPAAARTQFDALHSGEGAASEPLVILEATLSDLIGHANHGYSSDFSLPLITAAGIMTVIATGLLGASLVIVAMRTHRVVNPALLGATAGALVMTIAVIGLHLEIDAADSDFGVDILSANYSHLTTTDAWHAREEAALAFLSPGLDNERFNDAVSWLEEAEASSYSNGYTETPYLDAMTSVILSLSGADPATAASTLIADQPGGAPAIVTDTLWAGLAETLSPDLDAIEARFKDAATDDVPTRIAITGLAAAGTLALTVVGFHSRLKEYR